MVTALDGGNLETGIYREYQSGALRIAATLEARPQADRLTVILNGYCYRGKEQPPVFAQWPSSDDVPGHVLRVCDPTLFLSDWLKGSSFIGTEADDPIPAIVKVSKEIARDLGANSTRVLYVGHSGAGYGALQCAILDDHSVGIGINPLVELGAYTRYTFGTKTVQSFRAGASLAELCRDYPRRFSVTNALKHAFETGKEPRLGLIQNVLDKTHFFPHYGACCEALGIPISGGPDAPGRCHSLTYEKTGGHSALPELPTFRQMVKRMLPDGG